MSIFDEILSKSLAGINEGFQIAVRDLESTADEVTASIQKYSGLPIRLVSHSVLDESRRSVFRVYLDIEPSNSDGEAILVKYFEIPSRGYPISHGSYRKNTEFFTPNGQISNKTELAIHFSDMLSDPDSAIVQGIGFAMRQKAGKSSSKTS